MAKALGIIWPQDGQGSPLYVFPGDQVVASCSLQDWPATRLVVHRQCVFLFDLTTDGAVSVHRGRETLRGKALADGITLLDGDVIAFGRRRYQFSRAEED